MPCSSLYTHFRCSWLLCSMYSNWPQMLNSEPWTEPNWHQKNQATSFTPMSISDVPQEIWSSKTGLLWSAKISPPGVLSLDFPALLSSLLTELCLFAPLVVSFPSSSCWRPFQLVLSHFTSSPPVSSRLGSCAPPDSWLVNCKGPCDKSHIVVSIQHKTPILWNLTSQPKRANLPSTGTRKNSELVKLSIHVMHLLMEMAIPTICDLCEIQSRKIDSRRS